MNQDEQFLDKLKQAVFDNLANEQFGVIHLAKTIGLSRSHLHRKLKKLKKQSISQFIRQIRLEKAMKLILEDKATTAEIAYQVGFNSSSYFHKCFHDHYGYPPSKAKYILESQLQNRDSLTSSENDIYKSSQTAIESSVSSDPIKHAPISYKAIIIAIVVLLLSGGFTFYYFNHAKTDEPIEKSIAILPFKNLSTDSKNQYFADGLVEDLLNRLALIDEFKVISRTSSSTYRERKYKKIPEIADELDVSYIVEGSVRKYDNMVRITVQLIDAKNDKHIWTDSYDKDIADVFKTQSEIAVRVASELTSVLTKQQTAELQKNPTENIKAFELYQLGRHHWNKRTHGGLQKSISYFEKAIEEDPNFALAIANLADSYFLLSFQKAAYKKYVKEAEQLASNALDIDKHLPEAYNVLGGIYSFVDLDWAAAENIFSQGLKYNPNHSNLHHRYSEHLSMTGRQEEARQHIDKAIELNPLSFIIRSISARHYCTQGQFNESLAEIKICNELIPDLFHPRISSLTFEVYAHLGEEQTTVEYLKNWEVNRTTDLAKVNAWDSIYTSSGIKGVIIREAELTNHAFGKANIYGLCGEYEKAMDFLEKAYENSPSEVQDILFSSNFKNLHSHPRFKAILKKMNLPWSPNSVE